MDKIKTDIKMGHSILSNRQNTTLVSTLLKSYSNFVNIFDLS